MNHQLISRRIKEIRTAILKMNQAEFAHALGLKSKSAVSMWENEHIEKCPSRKTSLDIAKLANISVSYVLGESDQKDPKISAKDELDILMDQIRTKNSEKQKELLDIIRNLVKISSD